MAQLRVVIPESPSPTYHHPSVIPPWQHYREGSIRLSPSRTSRTSASSVHTRSIPVCPSPRRTRTTSDHHPHRHLSHLPNPLPPPPTPPLTHAHLRQHHHHQPARSHSHYKEGRRDPWDHMAQTYAWVMEQEIAEMSRKNEETVRWIMEQQEREARERTVFAMLGLEHKYREMMEQLVDDFEDITEQLKAQEDRRRHRAMFWQREMEKTAAYDELKRREHAAWREEVESYRVAYDRRKAQEAEKERARREQERQRLKAARDEAEKEAWRRYEEGWNALNPTSSSETTTPLTFNTIPWPLVSPPSKLDDITAARVAMFLLSSNHSDGLSRKERMKNALRRWHPDRFGRILARVIDEEKKDVEEGAGIIVRCLNNLMERESRMIAQNAQNH